jgi:hypothetical protein
MQNQINYLNETCQQALLTVSLDACSIRKFCFDRYWCFADILRFAPSSFWENVKTLVLILLFTCELK